MNSAWEHFLSKIMRTGDEWKKIASLTERTASISKQVTAAEGAEEREFGRFTFLGSCVLAVDVQCRTVCSGRRSFIVFAIGALLKLKRSRCIGNETKWLLL